MKQSVYLLLALVFLAASSVIVPHSALASVSNATATPTASPSGGAVADNSTVTLSDTTSGALIFYTTDGSTPSIGGQSTLIGSSPVPVTISGPVGSTVTVEAFALSDAFGQSTTATFTYTVEPQAAKPTATPASGSTVADNSTVNLADTTPEVTIYYTTDGTTPNMNSPNSLGGAAVTISGAPGSKVTVEAFAAEVGYLDSAVATFTYTVAQPPPLCITKANLPADFTLVSCVTSLQGDGGTSSIAYDAAKAAGLSPERLIVYRIEDGTATRYRPTTILQDSAEVLDPPAGTYAVLLSTRTYSDMAQESAAVRQAVDLLTAAQAVVGFDNGTFQPDAAATQGHVAKMIDVVLGLPVPAVPADTAQWADPHIRALDSELGATPYMVLSPARSGSPMTQGQFAAVLAQALHLVTGTVTEQAGIAAVANAGLMTVTDPNQPLTRAEAVQALAAWIATQAPPEP